LKEIKRYPSIISKVRMLMVRILKKVVFKNI